MNAAPRAASPTTAAQVAQLTRPDEASWDRFVHAHPEGTFFHLAGWRTVLERAFGHRSYYLLAQDDAGVQGVLPLARVRSRLFGDALISTPFCVYGGAIATSEATRRALEDSAFDLAQSLGVDYLELRNRRRCRPELPSKDLYVTFRKQIHPDHEANLAAIPRKQRAMVRKGIGAGLGVELDDGVDRLYRVYSDSVRNLGTPVFSRRYLDVLREVFPKECEVQSITLAGTPVAAVLSFYFRDEVLPYYGGGTAQARDCYANDFMYWALMRRAAERGVRIFDYGRSKRDSGSFRFKTHWGFEPEPLHYEYFLVRARSMPDLSPNNPRYRALIGTWRRLPLWVTRVIGPPVARYLG